ncbi:MAG: ABC transporter ATP-binding protein [Gemmatimonadota bacterium]
MTEIPAVELDRVTKSFGTTKAVDQLSFQIHRGEFFSILGPSGCGKTTTLRLLAGLDEADSGTIRLSGEVVNRKRPYERGLGMVFQSYALFPHLTVHRNIAFGLEQHRVAPADIPTRVAKALELVRLDPAQFAARMPSQLSGGQRQRVALARALVLEPALLLLDEPLGAIDLKLRKAMQLELKALNRSLGITFVYVTHDQEEALTMSDRIAVMDQARLAQLGTPAQIYENPRTAFVASFIGESNFLGGTAVRAVPGGWEIEGAHGAAFRVANAESIRAGERVEIAIRPEWMDVFSPDTVPPGENQLTGIVQDVVYLGEMMHVVVDVERVGEIKVALRNEGQLTRPIPWRRGDRAVAAWLPEDCQVLEPA